MNKFFRRLIKFAVYLAGGLVILLAIAVGLFRLFLPRLPEYQDDIKEWASAAIGLSVEFSGMDARWGLSGPEIEFYDAELMSRDNTTRLVAANEVSVGIGLARFIFDGQLAPDQVAVRETSIEVRQLENGEWWVQGNPLDQLLPERNGSTNGGIGRIEVVGEDIELLFLQPGDERPKRFLVSSFLARRDDVRLFVDATVELPQKLGRRLTIAATQLLSLPVEERSWNVTVDIEDIELAGVMAMQPAQAAHFNSGSGDIELSLEFANKRIKSATADIDIDDIAIAGLVDLALSGRLEFLMDDDGWLVAANDLRATTPAGKWPVSTLRLETSTDQNGKIVMIDAQASYLNFAHAAVVMPWLNEEQRAMVADVDPSGIVRSLALTVSDLDADVPNFDISMELLDVGIAASGNRPGIRGFSGSLRSDRSGGRLEIETDDLVVTAPLILAKPLGFDTTSGTVIWRRSNNRTTLLSDSIVLQNDFFENETSVEVSYVDGDAAPVVDIESTFSISDIAVAKRYIPYMAKRPRMSQWFQEGLVSGHIPRGKARLRGPLDKFPFDEGEGLLLIEGNIRDAVVVYQPKWPAAEVISADVVVENMRLYSERSRIINAGNEIVNGKLEIANFRQPVLTLSALVNGTLESLHDLAINSPINETLGGQLDNVSVSGAATASLDLSIPIRDWESFEFTTRLQTSDGSFEFDGFSAPLTELSGVVTIEREDVSSESLSGQLLGRAVSIELMQAPETMPNYRVIADATGGVTAEALSEQLRLPLAGRISGEAAYTARLLFPRGNIEEPSSFTVEVASDLVGLAFDYPAPLGKPAEDSIDFSGDIYLPRGGERIESKGSAGDLLSWQIAFTKDEVWDLNSGLIVFGTEPVSTTLPETRGLHLRGNADYVYAQDWFDMAKNAETKVGMAERIRSIDMSIKDLHLIGQHLVDHRIRMDRSAQDWLVQLEGESIVASTFVPYDFNSGRSIVIEAEKLLLPGDDQDADRPRTQIDPRSLPSITVKAGELAFGDRHLGEVEATFERTADGLVSDAIIAKDPTFEIVGNGSWVVDESDPIGYRSQIMATLTSSDVKTTMMRLGYSPGIVGDELSMLLDLGWSGGPSEDLMESLDGEVTVKIGSGRLEEVKPGAGRVFGLMSVAALPRRLALDFRDVFGKGFAFDQISSTFTLIDGNAYTCDLALEGPAADIGIVGRAGLVARDYEQIAIVSANFGNALPVAGALVAGPQVAAVLLIFSQIFKKPLKEVSQVYYDLGGTFDEPVVETSTEEMFALLAEKTSCVKEAK